MSEKQILGWHSQVVLNGTKCSDCHISSRATTDNFHYFNRAHELDFNEILKLRADRSFHSAQQPVPPLSSRKTSKVSKLWIGIASAPAQRTAIRIQIDADTKLNAFVETGLSVTRVTPKSPASHAGVKEGDVIHRVNGEVLHSVEQLVSAIDESEGRSMELLVIRDSESKKIEVLPQKRPDQKLDADVSRKRLSDAWNDRSGDDYRNTLLNAMAIQSIPSKLPAGSRLEISLDSDGNLQANLIWKSTGVEYNKDIFNDEFDAFSKPVQAAVQFIKTHFRGKSVHTPVVNRVSSSELNRIAIEELKKQVDLLSKQLSGHNAK